MFLNVINREKFIQEIKIWKTDKIHFFKQIFPRGNEFYFYFFMQPTYA